VILLGVAGALEPSLEVGQVIRPGRVVTDDAPPIELDGANADADTPLYTSPTLISSVAEKAKMLAEHGCPIVDMESYHAADLLRQRGVPLTVIRAVSDTADVALPPQTLQWVRDDGQPDAAAAAFYLATHPWAVSTLLGLRDALRLAAGNLAEAVDAALREPTPA
jgi:hypothetical protein